MLTQRRPAEPSITSSSANLYGLTVDMVPEWWPHVSHFINAAAERSDGKFDLESIHELIMKGDMQLWVVVTDRILAAGVTQVHQYPLKKACIVMFLGGDDMPLWTSTINILEKVAQEWGCDYLEVMGRKGWAKVLPDYEQTYITLRKKLWPQD